MKKLMVIGTLLFLNLLVLDFKLLCLSADGSNERSKKRSWGFFMVDAAFLRQQLMEMLLMVGSAVP